MKPLRALLVEDSELDAELILRQLERSGYGVTHRRIEDREAFITALSEEAWDVVLADYRLPEFDAPAALSALQQLELDIPFIVVSGAIGEEIAVDMMRAGASDYLIKGNLARLGVAIERELADARQRRARRQALQDLLESERNLRNSQSMAHVGHWIRNLDTGLSTWSQELFHIFGVDPLTAQGNLYEVWRQSIHPLDLPNIIDAAQAAVQNKDFWRSEYRIVRPDGEIRYLIDLIAEPVFAPDGRLVQVSGVIQDITERKITELALINTMRESLRRAEELERITAVSSEMRKTQTRAELIDVILKHLVDWTQAPYAALVLNAGSELYVEQIVLGRRQTLFPKKSAVIKEILETLETGRAFDLLDQTSEAAVHEVEMLLPGSYAPGTTILRPLHSGMQTLGLIVLGFERRRELEPDEANLLAAVAEMAGNALNRMHTAEEKEKMAAWREKELDLIYRISAAASGALQLEEVLHRALHLTLTAIEADAGEIQLLDSSGQEVELITRCLSSPDEDAPQDAVAPPAQLIDTTVQSRQSQVVVDGTLSNLPVSHAALPMRVQDRMLGIIAVTAAGQTAFDKERLALLDYVAGQLALIVDNYRLHKVSEKTAILEERSRLARELHDSVTQSLYSANLFTAGARRFLALGQTQQVESYLEQIGALTHQSLRDMRLLIYELRAEELIRQTLPQALQNRIDAVERRAGLRVDLKIDGTRPIPERVEEALYRIAIEGLNNALKHSGATHLNLELRDAAHGVELFLEDNGSGFDATSPASQGGMGLTTMRERAEQLNGTFELDTCPGGGTRIHVLVEY